MKNNRITGWKLQQRRNRMLMRQPLCVHCQANGLVSLATQLDHIVALCNGGKDEEANLQPLCAECHRVKTASDKKTLYRPPVGLDGWHVAGGGKKV